MMEWNTLPPHFTGFFMDPFFPYVIYHGGEGTQMHACFVCSLHYPYAMGAQLILLDKKYEAKRNGYGDRSHKDARLALYEREYPQRNHDELNVSCLQVSYSTSIRFTNHMIQE